MRVVLITIPGDGPATIENDRSAAITRDAAYRLPSVLKMFLFPIGVAMRALAFVRRRVIVDEKVAQAWWDASVSLVAETLGFLESTHPHAFASGDVTALAEECERFRAVLEDLAGSFKRDKVGDRLIDESIRVSRELQDAAVSIATADGRTAQGKELEWERVQASVNFIEFAAADYLILARRDPVERLQHPVGRARLFSRPWVITREYHRVIKEQIPAPLAVHGSTVGVHLRVIIDVEDPISARQEATLLRLLRSRPRR